MFRRWLNCCFISYECLADDHIIEITTSVSLGPLNPSSVLAPPSVISDELGLQTKILRFDITVN